MQPAAVVPPHHPSDSTEPLRIILNATSTLLAVPQLSHVLPQILELASRIIPADGYAIWRANPDKSAWHTIASRGLSKDYKYEVDDAQNARMDVSPIIATDVQSLPLLASRSDVYEREGIKSLLALPLIFDGAPQGTICFYYRSRHDFHESEINYGSVLANIASAAIGAAEMYDAQIAERLRSDFLANAGVVLASSLDYQATLRQVANLAVAAIADWCTVQTYFGGQLESLAVAHQDPRKLALAEDFRRQYPDTVRPGSATERILRTGKSELYPIISDELLARVAIDAEHLRMMRELGMRSAIAVPIKVRGRVIGLLRLISAESGKVFTSRDLKLAEDLAVRAGVAIDNARLYEALQSQQREQRQVLDTLPSLVAFIGKDQRYQFANRAYTDWFGVGVDITGMSIRDLIGEAAYETVRPEIERTLAGEQLTFEKEVPFVRGGTRTIRAVHLPNRAETGEVLGYVAFISDISAEKAATEAMRISEARFRGIFANASVPMVLTELDGTFIRANEAYCRFTGYSEEELRQTAFHKLTHPEDAPRNLELYRQLLAGEVPNFTIEKRYIRKDREIVWIRAGASLMRDASGQPSYVIGIGEDITARKKAEFELTALMSALQTERGQLQAAVEQLRLIEAAVNAGTWEWDIITGISHWPPGISALWGLPPATHNIGFAEFAERIYPEDRERVAHTIQQALATSRNYEVEFRVVWPDGSVHWLSARGAIVRDEFGKPVRVVGIALEVTERIKTEEALRQSEKLAAAGRLAATIAHEINNPLEAVTNLLFLSRFDKDLPEHVRNYLAQADQELGRVSHIARQTLGFYRESSHPQRLNLTENVEQVIALYRRRIASKNITLKVDLAPEAHTYAAQGEIRQVISNLILNAVDAVPMQGLITVALRRHDRRGLVRLFVADNGSGITPENRAKLFQPFFTTKRDVGTGLGLWVSKGIIAKHSGRILVRSKTGDQNTGTIFVIELPLYVAESAQPALVAA